MVERRAAGLPLEHVLGWAEFCGLRIDVEPGVFVPRPRSEFLVEQAAALAPAGSRRRRPLLRLGRARRRAGRGRGRRGAARRRPRPRRCRAAPGATSTRRGGHVYQGDLYAPLPESLRGRVDILLANVPYVPTEAIALMPSEARLHEPRLALDGGADGLDVLRRVADGAPRVARHGRLAAGRDQRALRPPQALEAFARAGLAPRVARSEELDATVVIGTAA